MRKKKDFNTTDKKWVNVIFLVDRTRRIPVVTHDNDNTMQVVILTEMFT